jgi:tRNA (mo5U34)-methyltransferase
MAPASFLEWKCTERCLRGDDMTHPVPSSRTADRHLLLAKVLEGKTREELLELAMQYRWWHAIDLGGIVTSGVRSSLIDRAFEQIDFKGKKVLDVGCWDGLWSFEAEKRGASEVYSVDYVSLRSWSEQPTYQLAHTLLGSKARYYPNLSVYDITRLGITGFDVVIYCGVYYHLVDPLRAFAALREVMAEGGIILVEGPVLDHSEKVFANFYHGNWLASDPTNCWLPSVSCLREWLDCTLFDPISEISFKKDVALPRPAAEQPAAATATPESQDRYIVLARATSVSERLTQQMNVQGLEPLQTIAGVTRQAIAWFCEAATLFFEAQPWRETPQGVTIKVESVVTGPQPLFVMALGHRSRHRGLFLYYDRGWLTMTLQGWLTGSRMTWTPFLAVLYRGSAELPSGESAMLRSEGWIASKETYPLALCNDVYGDDTDQPVNKLRRPSQTELQLLEACCRVLPMFIEKHKSTRAPAVEDVSVATERGELKLTLSWMTEGVREF